MVSSPSTFPASDGARELILAPPLWYADAAEGGGGARQYMYFLQRGAHPRAGDQVSGHSPATAAAGRPRSLARMRPPDDALRRAHLSALDPYMIKEDPGLHGRARQGRQTIICVTHEMGFANR
jgi:hypothetical protein